MSLKINIFASYISQFYVVSIGVIIVPFYITYMGAEAYGLVGFFAMMQAWFNLLDMGLRPTMIRETARFQGGTIAPHVYRQFVQALEIIFLGVALIIGSFLFFGAGYIATSWLDSSTIQNDELQFALQLMAVNIALRWMSGLYKGAVSGAERIIWLGWFNSFIATLRFIGVLPVLIWISTTPVTFFAFQLLVAILEFIGLVVYSYRLFPPITAKKWVFSSLKPTMKFSLTIAFTSSVWVLITQTDKLVLSKLLPLDEYGYFTLAVLVASGVMLLSGPISTVLLPRMARLESQGKHSQVIDIYRKATQFVAVFAGSASIVLFFFSEPLLLAWTGNELLARRASSILALYAIGNGILALSAFPYYLQYAKGDLRLHLIGNAIFVVLLIPAIIWATYTFGSIGAGYVWLGMNALVFILWLPVVHRKFAPGLNAKWYSKDTVMIYLAAFLAGYALYEFVPIATGRFAIAGEIILFAVLVVVGASVASTEAWKEGLRLVRSRNEKYGTDCK